MCCSKLQCVAVCCSVLHCVAVSFGQNGNDCAVRCSALQCVAGCCRVLQGVAGCCNVYWAGWQILRRGVRGWSGVKCVVNTKYASLL